MATDAKRSGSGAAPAFPHRGIRIFTYPKIIFIWPTLVASILAAIIMGMSGNRTEDPRRFEKRVNDEVVRRAGPAEVPAAAAPATDASAPAAGTAANPPVRRFSSPQNVAGVLFLTVFFLNLIVMAVDFPRFTIVAMILAAAVVILGFLYLNVWFDLLPPLVNALEGIYAVANTSFYALIATIILLVFAVIWVTRYLDYWVIMPNEILHNHGPFSDLERFPTFNLKFDKEIPDILEYALLGAGRLILHVPNEKRAIVLDNVLWIDSKENELKKLMSRMDVRVTTDTEAAEPA